MKKLLLLIIVLSATIGSMAFSKENESGENDFLRRNTPEIIRSIDLFSSLYKELNINYVDSIDNKGSIETAINAMLRHIDPYTEYINSESQEAFFSMSSGEYGGIGSYIQADKSGGVMISGPYAGSPAAKAGLKPGDKILKIDDDTVANWATDKVSERLKGHPNTTIKVTVRRPYVQDSILTFDIKREKIFVASVPYYGIMRGNVGVISINSFKEKTPEEVRLAVDSLKRNRNLSGLVLDLRGNGGGLLESAVQVVGMFVPKGTQVIVTRGREKKSEKIYKTTQKPIDTKIPLIVLIDGASASASEIVAGSLQDLDRAVIMGARSYGKGLVQSTRPLPYDGVLKVTIAKYYIPSGRLIQAIDYSHRNVDGSVERIPDSLTTVFHTANGREVRDGGGITPDIKIEYPQGNRLMYNLYSDNWFFDFANRYAAEHPRIASAEEFQVSDELFEQFKASIDPEKFDYDKVCEVGLKNLREIAKTEGYMNDSTSAVFDQLGKLLKHNLNKDLDQHKKEIVEELESEILMRYYYQRGETIARLKHDNTLDKAAEIFNTPGEWNKILSPKKISGKKDDSKNLGAVPANNVPRQLKRKR